MAARAGRGLSSARMKFDVELDSGAFYPASAIVELAELAEERGFDAIWKGESNSTDPIVLLSAIAARTKTIKLGTAIYHVYGRTPVTMGVQAATLNDVSDGRFLLGLGVANRTIALWHQGTFDRPLRRIREYVEVVRAVSSGEKVEVAGELYPTSGFKLSWRPRHPTLTIYYAGLGDQMTRLAGKIADGVIVNMANPATVRRIVENVRAGAAEAGRDPGAIEIAVKVRCAINDDRAVAKRKLKQVLTFYNLADHYKDLVASMGFAAESQRIRDAYAAGGFKAAMAEVTDGMVDGLPTIAATSAAEVRERVRPWIDAGATRLIIPPVPCTDEPVHEARGFLRGWQT